MEIKYFEDFVTDFFSYPDNDKVMDTLIKHGGNVNMEDIKRHTPLHLAALNSIYHSIYSI